MTKNKSPKPSELKEVSKSLTSDILEDQKCLIASAKVEDGVTCCNLDLSKDDMKTLAKSTGCKIFYAAQVVITNGMETVAGGVNDQSAVEVAYNEYLAMAAELNPHDGFEGMLINQMFVTFKQAMHYIKLANLKGNRGSNTIQDSLMNRSVKLMRLYNQQLETLDKHRRKGNQKMTVEHVHVHKGGQAIVGTVTQGERVNNEK